LIRPFTILAPGPEAAAISDVLTRAGIASRVCPALPALVPLLDDSAGVIVAESLLFGDALADLLLWVEQQKPWSDLAFFVLATRMPPPDAADDHSILDGLGNAVLLEWPLKPDSLASAARMALRAQRRQHALRDLTDTLETRVASRTALLAESEARFRTMFEAFPDILFTLRLDPTGRLRFESFNPSAERRTGLRAASVRGQTLEDVFPPDAARNVGEKCARCLAEQTSLTYTETTAFPAGEGTFETTLAPMAVFEGRDPRILGLSRDVTERNRLEERLRAAQKLEAVGQLTGGVAHDFNNLLQVVLSGLTLIERAADDPKRRAQVLDSVRRAALRGGELTKRLLTIARKQSLNPAPLDLGGWLRAGAVELLARTLRGDIVVRVEVQEQLPPVEVDANELELALLNVAVNARDAMPAGGTLTLSAAEVELDTITDPDELSGRYVRLSVADTGMGMSPEVQAKVFEPFFTTKDVGKGTGLGLAQVYGFARQSGGGVRLRSAPGQGTTVSLLLPMAHEAPPQPAVDGKLEPVEPAPGAAILVCEDDEEVAALVVDMLTQLGHAPTRVSTAAAALGALTDDRRVDLLFSDVMMPGGMDGLALAREAARRRPGLPVLLTTGYTGLGGAEPLGVPVLHKPYSLDELARSLQQVLTPS
jgi:PAS domain S-box-containing protein